MMPEEFFTWEYLGTYAGATIAVMLFVQFTKELPGIKSIPTRIWAYIIAAVLLVLSTVFTISPITPSIILLCLINAVIVAMAACGGYDTLHNIKTSVGE
jgi:hypothetical protein